MSQYIIKKSQLKGAIVIPPSKSHTLRAILFGSLAQGKSLIHNPLFSSDAQSMIEACRLFGAKIELFPTSLSIEGIGGKITSCEDVIHAGNSGIVLRFCTAIGALSRRPIVVTGDYSIRHQRPMQQLLEGLSQLGVSALSMRGDGYAPVIIQGPIKAGQARISGEDSQPVSALITASAFAEGPIEIHVKNPGEKPWIELTLDWLHRLGIAVAHKEFKYFSLQGNAQYGGFEYTVPGDFSSAAFPLVAALVTHSTLKIDNVTMKDVQGDKEVIPILQRMGAEIEIDEPGQSLYVRGGNRLSGLSIDINNFVDAITILAVAACYAEGETLIYNGAIAKQKECNRIASIAKELKKMGAIIEETEDGLKIHGTSLRGTHLHSHNDHRMVMSLAVAALGSEGETVITPIDSVSKTFPTFVHDFNALGAHIQEVV